MTLRCDMPTAAARPCKRRATVRYVQARAGTSAEPDLVVAQYCRQHAHASNHARMLRPYAWEYDYVSEEES